MFPKLLFFAEHEFSHPEKMDVAFLLWLDKVRERSGVPFVITSSWRDSATSLHGLGMAVDLRSSVWSSIQKFRVAAAIFDLRFDAPGKVEFEPVFSPTDKHWHLGVDPRPGKEHEFVEADE